MKTLRGVCVIFLFTRFSCALAAAGDGPDSSAATLESLDAGWTLARAYQPDPGEDSPRPEASLTTLSLAALPPLSTGGLFFGEDLGYAKAKVGPLFFIDDFNDMSPGFEIDGAIGFHIISILGLEASSGYFRGEDSGSPDKILWGVPIEGRAILEIPILPIYFGLGIGGYHLDTETKGTGGRHETDFVAGWNALVGLQFGLGPLTIGAEGKFVMTDEARTAFGNDRLEGFALMATVGLRI